jgi:hypothetical protein
MFSVAQNTQRRMNQWQWIMNSKRCGMKLLLPPSRQCFALPWRDIRLQWWQLVFGPRFKPVPSTVQVWSVTAKLTCSRSLVWNGCYAATTIGTSVSDVDRYVIIKKATIFHFNIVSVLGLYLRKVAYTRHDVISCVEQMDFSRDWGAESRVYNAGAHKAYSSTFMWRFLGTGKF